MPQHCSFAIAAVLSALLSIAAPAAADSIVWHSRKAPLRYSIATDTDPVVATAVGMFSGDLRDVTEIFPVKSEGKSASLVITQLDRASSSQRGVLAKAGVPVGRLDSLTDGFHISVSDGKINLVGSNGRGVAYGLLELSRMAGVSPWIWWGDVIPERKESLVMDENFSTTQGASVEYRGIFINDEDWSLRPWSSRTFEPNDEGTIGPKTYKEIFKLLMRLRANAVWPAMHPGTTAFFSDPANKLIADSCGIAVGTSHCEPLLRNNVGEWDVKKRGAFNYMTNRDAVHEYWIERLREVKGSAGGNMFTIGMRGIHDGSMEGVRTMQEKFDALQQVIRDQQDLISEYIGDPSEQMQVFVPYKEVLELYEMGLEVPDYVTLMWCDDNYGYITRLSDPEERRRSGGAGVYYHLSYWGRPHDHLWLTTTQPGLICNEMRAAYDHDMRKLWIANVHDPKVAAYDLSLFLDMAWDIDCVSDGSVGEHLRQWLVSNFGEECGSDIYPVMRKFYDLTAKRKPEFMGWSQVELDKKVYNRGLSPVADTQFSFSEFGGEADRYMEEWIEIASDAERISRKIRPELQDAYFAAVLYPVGAAASHAVKLLEAQRARQLKSAGDSDENDDYAMKLAAAKSLLSHLNVVMLTGWYNEEIAGGKWRGSMSMSPRDLPVYGIPNLPVEFADGEDYEILANAPEAERHPLTTDGVIARRASDYDGCEGDVRVVDMLGHSGSAVSLGKGSCVSYGFTVPDGVGYRTLTAAMIPTHPVDSGDIRFSVSIDGAEPRVFSLKETFRSEPWKQNVLRGQALRVMDLPALSPGPHTLTVKALDEHVVFDQWLLDSVPTRSFYLIPTP